MRSYPPLKKSPGVAGCLCRHWPAIGYTVCWAVVVLFAIVSTIGKHNQKSWNYQRVVQLSGEKSAGKDYPIDLSVGSAAKLSNVIRDGGEALAKACLVKGHLPQLVTKTALNVKYQYPKIESIKAREPYHYLNWICQNTLSGIYKNIGRQCPIQREQNQIRLRNEKLSGRFFFDHCTNLSQSGRECVGKGILTMQPNYLI